MSEPHQRIIDPFYTRPDLAEWYVEQMLGRPDLPPSAVFLEPSAGSGAFVKPLRRRKLECIALDTHPQGTQIQQGDFLKQCFWPRKGKTLIVLGNPPFGFASSLAIRFFNRAAERAQMIAFIVPRTFRKISVLEKLPREFWLIHNEDVPPRAFLKDGHPHDVPCAWQIWERREILRTVQETPDISSLLEFTSPQRADFALRRVGGRAGKVLPLDAGQRYSPSSTYFIRAFHPQVRELLENLNWDKIRNSTAGVRSVSKTEIAHRLCWRSAAAQVHADFPEDPLGNRP